MRVSRRDNSGRPPLAFGVRTPPCAVMRYLLAIVLLAGLALPAAADEVRFIYTISQAEVEFTPPGLGKTELEWDDSRRYELGAFTTYGSIVGYSLSKQEAEVSEDNWSLEYEAFAFRIYSGVYVAQSPNFAIELVPFTSIGLVRADTTTPSGSFSDQDWLLEYGAEAAISVNFGNAFSIGGGGGYIWTKADVDLNGGRSIDQDGAFIHAFIQATF